ncbi:unnamed protein product [Tenebrio molitor]|nr:unnamed protein product [Tenebrio molitor]
MAVSFLNVKAEYAKDKDLKEEDVQALMEWVSKQPHLPQINEAQAILFLQSCYYRNEAAKAALDTYFTVKTFCPDIFCNRNPTVSPLKDSLNVSLFSVLPRKTPEGYSVILMKLMDPNPDVYNFAVQLKYFDMACMLYLHQHGPSNGHLILLDMKEVVFGHVTKLGPLNMKKFLYYLQEAMPLRLKGLHYFNIVPFMDKILALMKPFMKKELMDMLYLHNGVDDLVKYVPLECLPQDYGGSVEATPILHEKVKGELLKNVAFFDWEDKLTVDESKRPGKPKNVGDIFGSDTTLSFAMELSLVDVKTQYHKDNKLKKEDVRALLDWSEKQPHLPQITELQAILFLQSCYYRNEAAKSALDNYFTLKTLCSDIFGDRNPTRPALTTALAAGVVTTLPKKTPEGYTLIFIKLADTNPNNFDFAVQLRYFDMVCTTQLYQEGTSEGHVVVADMKGTVFGHLTKAGPIIVKKFLFYLQEAMPVRLKGLHFFNIVPFMDKVLALIRPFLKMELMDMLHLHNGVEDLAKYVPLECLPQEYGGTVEAVPVLHEKIKSKLLENVKLFEWEQGQSVDESRRPERPKNVGDFFGIEGTFKKLEID